MSEPVGGGQVAERKTFSTLLTEMLPQFKAALPAHLKANAERYMRVAVTEYRRNPDLQRCDPYSVLGSAMLATGLGLEVGPGGRAYLIPYKDQCTFVPGWKGLVELANRSGRSSVWTGVIYEGQPFEYQQGDQPRLTITEDSDETDPEKIAFTYAVGRITGAEWPVIERWSQRKILMHRDKFNKVGAKHYSYHNWEMYARKVPLMQVLKYLPYSPELEAALVLDNRGEQGRSFNVQTASDAIDGVFEHVPDPTPNVQTEDRTASGRRKPQPKKAAGAGAPAQQMDGRDESPASEEQLAFVTKKASAATVQLGEVCKTFGLEKFGDLKKYQVPLVMKWLDDPATPPTAT